MPKKRIINSTIISPVSSGSLCSPSSGEGVPDEDTIGRATGRFLPTKSCCIILFHINVVFYKLFKCLYHTLYILVITKYRLISTSV